MKIYPTLICYAVGFLILGLVSMPTFAPIFLFGAVPLGVAVALLLRFTNTRRWTTEDSKAHSRCECNGDVMPQLRLVGSISALRVVAEP
jgi:hypothetical protein